MPPYFGICDLVGLLPDWRNAAMPDYRRVYLQGYAIFVTMVTNQRRPWLKDPANVAVLLDTLRQVKSIHPFRHLGHCILPDHVHLMLIPDDAKYSIIIAALKRGVTDRLKQLSTTVARPLWQRRFYDHVIRNEQDLQRHLDYIHFNPVKHGVALAPRDHAHSSFMEWCKRGVYDEDWGRQEPTEIASMNPE